jgi:serine protease Do
VTYDREEWRRPWRAADRRSDVDDHPSGVADHPAGVAERSAGVAGGPGGDADRGVGVATGRDTGEAPIARFPQPPPAGWDERSAGPGSPAGSIRPPDTTGTVDAPARPRRLRRALGVAVAALVGAVVGTLATLAIVGGDISTGETPTVPTAPADLDPSTEAEDAAPRAARDVIVESGSVVPAVAEAVTPSVVRINSRTSELDALAPLGSSLGSGVIYSSDGYILTNEHVVRTSDDVEVRLASGDILEGEVVGRDTLNDLAVVKVERDGLPEISFRPLDEPLVVGETVIAIGSPFGLDTSVTAGVISALDRELRLDEQEAGEGRQVIPSVIQTDAAINPGNSGGALVDASGRLIGINTAIFSASGTNQGVGFAVSAEQALRSADQLIEQGFVRHPLLGIAGDDLTPQVAERLGVDIARGAVVSSVQEGTGAAEVDLRPGDVIVAVDGEPLVSMSELVATVRSRDPGDRLELSIVRGEETFDLEVELSERER